MTKKWSLWMWLPAGIYVLLAAFSRPAVAAVYVTGEELVRNCISQHKQDKAACIYYIAGVIDYHSVLQSLAIAPTIDFCMPDSISKEQAAVLVLAYMRQSPQHDAFIAATSIPLALNKVFPCRRATKKKR